MRLSQKYADFNPELTIVLAYATTNAVRLAIADAQITALTAASTEWTTQYGLYQDPETHTQRQVETTRTAYAAARDLLTGIQQQVKNNRAVTLTDTDIDNMYIHRDAQQRGRVPVPGVPDNTLLDSKHRPTASPLFSPPMA